MNCVSCQRDIADQSKFCYFCGAAQPTVATGAASYVDPGARRLRRSVNDKVFGGVCGGFGEYFDVDPVIIRVVWAVLAFTTGIGFVVYLICWVVIDQVPGGPPVQAAAPAMGPDTRTRRLRRSAVNAKWAGVCGGIAEHLGVDPTLVRLVWVILSIVPGAIVGGLIAYLIAWMVMPAPDYSAQNPGQPVAHSS